MDSIIVSLNMPPIASDAIAKRIRAHAFTSIRNDAIAKHMSSCFVREKLVAMVMLISHHDYTEHSRRIYNQV